MARFGRTTGRVIIGRAVLPIPPADPLVPLLGSWAKRMKLVVYTRSTRLMLSRFVPTAVQVVNNTLPILMRPKQIPARTAYRQTQKTVFQNQLVNVVLPVVSHRVWPCPAKFVNRVVNRIVTLGPAAYIPIKGAIVRNFQPSRPVPSRRSVVFQTFVPIPIIKKIVVQRVVTRRLKSPYPIQPNILPIRTRSLWPVSKIVNRRPQIVPLTVPSPVLIVQRYKQRIATIALHRPTKQIPFNTPQAVVPQTRNRLYQRPGWIRRSVAFIPAAVQQVPVFVHYRMKFIPVPKFVTRSRPILVPGPTVPIVVRQNKLYAPKQVPRRQGYPFAVTTAIPVFVRSRPRSYPVIRAMPRRTAVVQTQAVVVVRQTRLYGVKPSPRRNGFPFAVDRPVVTPVPFPVVSRLPKAYRVLYPKLVPRSCAALPPPVVQTVLVANRRTVR